MALDFQLEPTFYGDFQVNNLAARQLQIVHGTFTYDAASSSALTITASMVGLTKITGFFAVPKDNVIWAWSPSTSIMTPLSTAYVPVTGTAYATFVGSATVAVASITSIPFLCWGFR